MKNMNENQQFNQESNNTVNPSVMGEENNKQSTPLNTEKDMTAMPPIAEVKVESSATTSMNSSNGNEMSSSEKTVANSTGESSPSSSSAKPPKNSKLSTILLIVFFLFLFAFIMGMPYIRSFIQELKADTGLSEIEKEAQEEEEKQQQEEENQKPTPTPEDEKTTELTCTSASSTAGNYTLVEVQKFYYNSKNQVLSSKMISQYSFTTADMTYLNLKQQCDEDSLKYLTHEGYTMACSYGENNIEISHEFDLETFTPIVDGATNIQANATYQQDIETIKADLASKGYTCQ